jgi:NitT/TauT family transport system permease protein
MDGPFIWQNMLYSLRLFTIGFSLGVALGVGTGILIGWFPKVYYWVYPVLKITGVIPAVAWMPFALTTFTKPFSAAVFLIVICAWFPVASLTAAGISSTPKTYFEVARTLGAKTPYLVFSVAIPHAMPNIFTGITTANAFAFTTLVIAEMMGQPGGLGYYINASRVWSAYYKVFAAIVVMAVLFSLIMYVLGLIQNRLLRWRKGLVKS